MPTSAPGTSERAARARAPGGVRGFTLIELLVVVLIAGVLTSLAALALSPESAERVARRDAERLALLLEMLARESSVTGQVLALEFADHGYRFLRRDALYGWLPLQNDDLFRPRRVDARTRARLQVDGLPAPADTRLAFRPSGSQDFLIELQAGDAVIELRGSAAGGFTVREKAHARSE